MPRLMQRFECGLPSTDTVEAWSIFLALSEGNEAVLGREKRLNLARYQIAWVTWPCLSMRSGLGRVSVPWRRTILSRPFTCTLSSAL